MEKNKNLHQGHRKRIINKFLEHPDSFCDHELLELLLFYAIPRKDTNELAHTLINTFGSLNQLFNASPEELQAVGGIGASVASYITLFGKLVKNYKEREKINVNLFSPENTFDFVRAKMRDKICETFIIVLMDEKYNAINTLEFTNFDKEKVEICLSELANAIIIQKPKFAIMAHNHPSGIADASPNDDLSTKKFNLLCAIHGVNLIDHIIYTKNALFSYRWANRMESIKKQTDVKRIMEQIKENHYVNNKN